MNLVVYIHPGRTFQPCMDSRCEHDQSILYGILMCGRPGGYCDTFKAIEAARVEMGAVVEQVPKEKP